MRFQRQAGFTLVDFSMTLAVFAILSTIMIPSVVSMLQTYRRNMAVRHVMSDVRRTQSLAVTRGGVFALQWGGGPSVARSPGEYRIVRDTSGACDLPETGAPVDGTDVIRGWFDLSRDYSNVAIESIRDGDDRALGGVMFDYLGASVNPCTSVSFPITITLSDGAGGTEIVEVRRSGTARQP